MDIQNLVRDKIIGNIKIGKKGENGIPKKLSFFNVEEDKGTSKEMAMIFKKLYPGEPTKLKIRFTSENPFNFKFKRYSNGKAVCIGNDKKAITVGKDDKDRNIQIEVDCGEQCEHRQSGKCKLKGNLKFVLEGIDAGGVWNLSTCGGFSLSNIATEIVKYKKANMSIVNVPFELTLTAQESLAYGTYYSIDLKRTDIKPQLTVGQTDVISSTEQKQLGDGRKSEKKKTKIDKEQEIQDEKTKKEDFSNYLTIMKFMPTLINNKKFDKIIFTDIHSQEVEYVLHPNADQQIMKCGLGTVIELVSSKMEADRNILCKYNIKEVKNIQDFDNQEMEKAV